MFLALKHKLSPQLLRFLLVLCISILFGSVWFLILYNRFPLYFTHINWIYASGADVLKTQLGWEWFRQEPWSFPLGRIESYGYPFGTYLAYMDSIPLMAILLKLFSPWLGGHFQYLGVWELASIIGQMFASVMLLNQFTRSYLQKILGASLLVLSPPMISRVFLHDSFTAHWIILAAIWFIILEYRSRLWRGAWVILFALAMLIQLYFVAMLLPLWAISLYFRYAREKRPWLVVTDILIVIGLIILLGYCSGLFSLEPDNLVEEGFGLYSWNLNGFVNPNSFSNFLKQMPVGSSKLFEGFSYLGLGNLLILPTAIFLFFHKDCSRRRLFFFTPFGLVSILFGIYALSQKAYLGAYPLWDIHLPDSLYTLCSFFRTSARFIWPVFYFIVLFGIISILRNFRYPTLILLSALILQYIDIQPLIITKKINGLAEYHSKLQAEFWQQAAIYNRHIFLLPASYAASSYYEPFALYARENQMTLNWGYLSRGKYAAIENYGESVWEELKVGQIDPQSLYILWNSAWIGFARQNLSDQIIICTVDGYTVILSTDNLLSRSYSGLTDYCTIPSIKTNLQ
jgi:hypothetical protein